MWLSGKDSGIYLGLQRDAIERRGIPWQDDPVPYKIRYKTLRLDPETKERRRYYRPDLDALLHSPSKRDHGPAFVPKFKRPNGARN